MKVICIGDRDSWQKQVYPKKIFWFFEYKPKPVKGYGPEYGETCTVVGQYESNITPGHGPLYYVLEEYINKPVCGYEAKYFIPCSEISETEMIREYNKELV